MLTPRRSRSSPRRLFLYQSASTAVLIWAVGPSNALECLAAFAVACTLLLGWIRYLVEDFRRWLAGTIRQARDLGAGSSEWS